MYPMIFSVHGGRRSAQPHGLYHRRTSLLNCIPILDCKAEYCGTVYQLLSTLPIQRTCRSLSHNAVVLQDTSDEAENEDELMDADRRSSEPAFRLSKDALGDNASNQVPTSNMPAFTRKVARMTRSKRVHDLLFGRTYSGSTVKNRLHISRI